MNIPRFLDEAEKTILAWRTKLILRARQEWFGAKIAFLYTFKRKEPEQIFFILCQHRTGSNLLRSYLNTIPGIACEAEILSRFQAYGLKPGRPARKTVFRHIRHSLTRNSCKVRGAKFFFEHFEERGVSLEHLTAEFPQARWIILYRKDLLAQFVSFKLACQSGRWFSFKDAAQKERQQIVFDPREALCFMNRQRAYYDTALKGGLLRGKSILISYEDLAENPQKLFDSRIFPFLNLPQRTVSTFLKKQNSAPLAEIISNYDEVRNMIAQTDFSQSYQAGQV